MPPILNIAAYQFATLTNLQPLRSELRELCEQQQLLGTILLSPEGINLFLAGTRDGVEALLSRVRALPGLADLPVKESYSDQRPFRRLLVKIKAEIIAFGIDEIQPARYTSPRLSPQDLKHWLDEGRPVVLLDTRNNFEVESGTFENAIPINVDDFRNFPEAVSNLPDDLKTRPIVTFCTGGIRCEKAAPYLERAGFQEVYQLDGGILKYFEECGGAHYSGDCFVFDQRVALDPQLQPSNLKQCYACQAILSVADQESPAYVKGVSCPHCYRSPEVRTQQQLNERHDAIRRATSPLPGSVPYENIRPISVPLRLDGFEVLNFLDAMRTHVSRDDWRQACLEGRLRCRGERVLPGRLMHAGETLLHLVPATCEPAVAAGVRILYEDEAIVVVHKPAPLPMHPCGRFCRNTLTHILDQVFAPLKPRPAHRLDADTSGVVVFSKTREVARRLQPQFETHDVRKTYLVRVHGHPSMDEFTCRVPIGSDPTSFGGRLPDPDGQPAITDFCVLSRLEDGTALLKAKPVTGRTHQIRVHLWDAQLPIIGDPIYLPERSTSAGQTTLSVDDPPLCLHALAIEFQHPLSRQPVRYEAPPPAWADVTAASRGTSVPQMMS